ncbi:MAG: ABC transporter permease [Bacilli bacterium]|nr:ABC transporter permease [Bacilli bacterium]
MLKYSLKRILLAFLTAFIILTLTFFLVKSLNGESVQSTSEGIKYGFYDKQVNLNYMYHKVIPYQYLSSADEFINPFPEFGDPVNLSDIVNGQFDFYDESRTHWLDVYYNVPIVDQYFSWIKNIVTKWDWGTSTVIQPSVDTVKIIATRLPETLKVNIVSVVLSVPIGIALGIFAGLKKNTWIDHVISTLVMIFISIPSFVIISFMIYLFGVKGSLPITWPENGSFAVRASGYIIPVLSLSFGSICGYCRFVRAELCEVMSSEYLLLARTKGLTKSQAITRHALRNAFVPILPSILAEVIGVFSGSMILENLYNIHGIGDLYVRSLNSIPRDYNVLMVDMAIFTTIGLLAGIVLDLSYGFIDPRIRMGEKGNA